MTLREIVFARCTTHVGMSDLIDDRCYPERLPEGVVYPAIRFLCPISTDSSPYRTHDNVNVPVGRSVDRIQLDCFDVTGDGAEALAIQAVQAWSGYKDGCAIGYSFIANQVASHEDGVNAFRTIVDVMVEHSI